MMRNEKELIESRGYVIIKLGGIERAVKNPMVFGMKSQPKVESLTRSFFESLKNQPVKVLTKEFLSGLSAEERESAVLRLMNS